MKKITLLINTICALFLIYSCGESPSKKHKLDGMWEYQESYYELADSFPDNIKDSILNDISKRYSSDSQTTYLTVIKDGEFKRSGALEDGIYYILKYKTLYNVDTLIATEPAIVDTLYRFTTNGEIAFFNYVDENNIKEFSFKRINSKDLGEVRYTQIDKFKKFMNDKKVEYIND